MSNKILKICPPEETFIDIKHQIKCPFDNCDKVIPQSGSLHKHLVKFHGVIQGGNDEYIERRLKNGNKPIDLQTRYHCPIPNCIYGVHTERYFTNISLLRQHYRKVHAEKKYQCKKCGCGFGMEKDKRAHEDRCGEVYVCVTCLQPYRSVEAIMTHCKRKDHQLPDSMKKGTRQKSRQKEPTAPKSESSTKSVPNIPTPSSIVIVNIVQLETKNILSNAEKLLKPILPKPLSVSVIPIMPSNMIPNTEQVKNKKSQISQNTTMPVQILPVTNNAKTADQLNLLNVDTKTDFVSTGTQISPGSPRIRKGNENVQKKRKSFIGKSATSTGIQTSISIIPKKKKCLQNVAQTQTAGDFILKTAMATADIPIQSESVGTQITPKSKSKHVRCNIETQTSNTSSPRRRRRRRLCGPEFLPKIDSVCQTVDFNTNVSVGQSCQILNKKMVSESAQTVVMVDENSQTVPFQVLQNHLNEQLVKGHNTTAQGHEVPSGTPISYPASNILQNISRNVLNTSDDNTKETLSMSEASTSPINLISIPDNDPVVQLPQSVNSRVDSGSTELCLLDDISETCHLNTTVGESFVNRSVSSIEKDQSVCNSGVQTSLGHLDLLSGTWSLKDKPFVTSDMPYIRTEHCANIATADKTLNNPDDTDVSDSHNIGVQTFESDLANFLIQCSSDADNTRSVKSSYHSQYPAPSSADLTIQTQTHNSSSSQSFMQNTSSFESVSYAFTTPQATSTTAEASVQINTKSTFSVQTDSSLTDFYPTADIHVQTLSSASDIDQLLQTACSSIQTDDVYPLMNIHTQTADDFDVLDLLMNNMETQTTDDLPLDGFSLADIETQTTNENDNIGGCQTTAATQTQYGMQTLSPNRHVATNIQTQTPYQGLFNFSMTDTHTQTTWQDLDDILSELNK